MVEQPKATPVWTHEEGDWEVSVHAVRESARGRTRRGAALRMVDILRGYVTDWHDHRHVNAATEPNGDLVTWLQTKTEAELVEWMLAQKAAASRVPYELPSHLAEVAKHEADDLTWDGVVEIPRHAAEAALAAVDYEAKLDADDAAWLLLAAAGYYEATRFIDSETDEPGQHASPELILQLIKKADTCTALGGHGDIRVYPALRHLTKQPDHRNADGTWKD